MLSDTEILRDQQLEIDALKRRLVDWKILSTLPFEKIPFWAEGVTSLRLSLRSPKSLLSLLWRSRKYDLVLLTGGERSDLCYAALAGLARLVGWSATPHVIVNAHWQKSEGLAYLAQRLILALATRSLVQVQVTSSEEIDPYHRFFGIPEPILAAFPWSTSILGYEDLEVVKGDKVFTGGSSFRDYPTFLSAVVGLGLPTEVILPSTDELPPQLLEQCRKDPNIVLHTAFLEKREYMRRLASCGIFALPIQPNLNRIAGCQTLLNAMYFRKVVVASNCMSARIYIKHGVNGFIVPDNTPEAWRAALTEVHRLGDADYDRIASRAARDARVLYNEPHRLCRTLVAALDAVDSRGRQPRDRDQP